MRHKSLLIAADNTLTGWDKRQVQREDDGAAERKRRQRSRTGDDVSRDVTQCPAPEKTREEKTRKKKEDANASYKEKAAPAKRGTRLSADWFPTPTEILSLKTGPDGFTDAEINGEIHGFRDYCIETPSRKSTRLNSSHSCAHRMPSSA